MDLLTTYTHHSELEVITTLSLISTLHKSQQHLLTFFFPACCDFISRSLATASNSGDFSASHAQVIFSQPPVQNSTDSRLQPGWRPFHTNLLFFSSESDFQQTDNCSNFLQDNSFARTEKKTPFPTVIPPLPEYPLPRELLYRSFAWKLLA
jgi:hypothetical protein